MEPTAIILDSGAITQYVDIFRPLYIAVCLIVLLKVAEIAVILWKR